MEPLVQAEGRVLGCLLEKQLATPQYYPLTLNALLAACNQSSNRDPVTDYAESEVADALAALRERGLVRVVHSSGNRVPKYRHVLDETWGLDDAHRAVLAVLLLRGPQTLGELRARTDRMASFASLEEIEEVLRLLSVREQPLARQLERQPGQKEARYAELLSGEVPLSVQQRAPATPGLGERVAALEEAVAALDANVRELRALLE
ncbi:MAG TPA: YceH family protein [Acidimicrobiales bacterium]|jgi:uncharacterized protein YceH (UPF0502 family)|nr:YceH family protein [Acidimicrobiales bacterium]